MLADSKRSQMQLEGKDWNSNMAETQAQKTIAPARPAAPGAPRGGNQRGGRGGDRRGGRGGRDQAPREEKIYEENVISIDRVARVVKGGRRFRFKALVVVGDRKNKLGVGVAKGTDVQAAVAKATDVAKKRMITVPVVNGTIPHEIEIKLDGARVLLKPAAPGTGVVAGGVVRSVVNVIGITDLLSKSLGSTNKVNIAYATVEALRQLVPRSQWVSVKNSPKKASKKTEEKETK